MSADSSIAQVRRRDRSVQDEAWIEDFLDRTPVCVIGTAGDDRTFLNPNLFIYDRPNRRIWFHTAGRGRTRSMIEQSERVTLCFFEMGRLLPAADILDYGVEYASVVVFGRASILTDPAKVRIVFEHQMRKYFPHHREGIEYRTFTDEEAARATVFEVAIDQWSAKLCESDPGHDGAGPYSLRYFHQ